MPREDDEEQPRRKRRDADEDDRPRRRRREDEDDDDDHPRRNRRDDNDDDDDDEYEDSGRRRRLPRATLRAVAGYQKGIIFCILAYLCLLAVQFVGAIPPEMRIWLAVAYLPVGITATVFVFLLATKVYSTSTGVVYALLTLLPCISLIILLVINGKATSILKENGIRVGLFDAAAHSDI